MIRTERYNTVPTAFFKKLTGQTSDGFFNEEVKNGVCVMGSDIMG